MSWITFADEVSSHLSLQESGILSLSTGAVEYVKFNSVLWRQIIHPKRCFRGAIADLSVAD
jgi:hypothetical protein